ncbi:serine hydrolase [Pedobacter caeni]|uniref:CubicO group peptidase, beta-lactamase class C family n=1 Tax=Pedobacter caeni TaxID=288992 RepID=A0A1M5ATJ6_9SPHI|nr:serine hydrolase [Pedobacter caeni]SHF33571.1 CubicO group peptidase, beta-lactamase class C family [Pedobacter caeni]
MNKSKLTLSLFLLFMFFINKNSFAQISNTEVDVLVENAIKKFNVAGAAVAIVKDGKVVYKKGFGTKSTETKQPVDENTNFAIGSNSKAFTTAALAILVEEGKLSWTDKVKKYIPEFKMYNDYVTENFNIQDLLTHRSGLGLGAGDLMLFPDGSDFTIKDVVSNFQYFKPVSEFRTHFDYDNQLYLVAGEVIARTSGMTWEDFVQKRIMAPLEMKASYSSLAGMKDKSNLSSAHSSASGVIKKIGTFGDMMNGAAGGIFSNADDMSKWMLVQLNKGKYGSTLQSNLFSPESQYEMWKIHTVEDTDPSPRYNTRFRGYGLGWEIANIKDHLSVSHTGGIPGMLSIVTMIPDLNLGITILTNTENGGVGVFSAVSQTIIDSYLGLADFGWTDKYYAHLNSQKNTGDEVVKKVWETVKSGKNNNLKKEDFTGVYQDKWFGKVEIYLKDKQLWFKSYRSPKLTGQMQFYKANTFAIKWEYRDMECDAFAMFSLDEEGKAQGIKMKGISPNIDFSFDFHDLDLVRIK